MRQTKDFLGIENGDDLSKLTNYSDGELGKFYCFNINAANAAV